MHTIVAILLQLFDLHLHIIIWDFIFIRVRKCDIKLNLFHPIYFVQKLLRGTGNMIL